MLARFAVLAVCAVLFAGALAPRATAADEPDPYPAVTAARLAAAADDDGWLMYRRSYDSHGYAPFTEITSANAASLQPVFTYATGMPQGHESPPIVNGRTLIVTLPLDGVTALDATTGKVLWAYKYPFSPDALGSVCCDVVNRGVALYGTNVYLGTIDDHLLALDARTGKVVWNRVVAPISGHYAITGAPLAVDGKIITGVAGGEYGARGFISAFDAVTGALVWKHWAVPAPSEPGGKTWPPGAYKRGGGDTWLTGSYDPATRTLYWGTGNPGPWLAAVRPGDNLYSDCVLALDVATGKMKWYFQFTPHDTWDYDGVNELVLVDLQRGGEKIPAIVHADRNGYFIALDRRNGKFLYARPFVKQTTIRGYTASGHAIIDPSVYPRVGKKDVFGCPSASGGKNWYPMAYSPATQLAYVPMLHLCASIHATGRLSEAFGYYGEISTTKPEPGHPDFGEFGAIDVRDGHETWSFSSAFPWTGGALATAGGVVFSGNASGDFYAFDAQSGAVRWKFHTSSGIVGVPTSYRVDGKQYVAVYSGYGGGLAIFGGPTMKLTTKVPRGGKLYVFALGDAK